MSDYMNQTEPYLVTIARLTAERDSLSRRLGMQAETITYLQGEIDRVSNARDELAGYANAYKAERDEARDDRDEAMRHEDAANRNYLRCLENEGRYITQLNEARSELAKLQDRKPVNSLEARIKALETLLHAR